MKNANLLRVKEIEKQNKQRLLEINPLLDEKSGIYFLTRTDENGERHFYVGQARHILSRLAQHLSNYQYIDVSIRKHGLYSVENPYGYKVNFLHYPLEVLDEKEKHYIKQYLEQGYIPKNKTAGGQGKGKTKIAEYKPTKTYRDGLQQGRKALARDLKHILDKHLTVELKAEKKANKTSQRAFEKFMELLNEENYREVGEDA